MHVAIGSILISDMTHENTDMIHLLRYQAVAIAIANQCSHYSHTQPMAKGCITITCTTFSFIMAV